MADGIKYCRNCGQPANISAKFCRKCGAPFTTQQSIAKNKSKKIRIGVKPAVAVLLSITLLFTAFVKPGFFRKKPKAEDEGVNVAIDNTDDLVSGIGESLLKSEYKTEPVASGTLTLEDRTLKKGDISVTVEEGFLGEDRGITINRVTEPINYSFDDGVEVPLTAYEVNIDGIHDESMITIELPMDKSAAPEYRAGYIDEETLELRPALNEYNPDTGILTIHTTHLSTFCGIPVNNEKTRNATLAYVSAYDLFDNEEMLDYYALMSILKTSYQNEPSIECGMSVLDQIGMIQGGSNVLSDLIKSPLTENIDDLAEGAGKILYMGGNRGTIGEIMNTNWGRSGSLSLTAEPGKTATKIVGYDQQLKSVYPGKVVDKISSGLQWAGRCITLAKIVKNIYTDGWTAKSTGSEALKWTVGEALGIYAEHYAGTAALGIYLIGVAALGMAIDYVYTEALEGRKEVYIHAYQKYYSSKQGHRTDDQWITEFKKIMKNGGGMPEFEKEIDDYVYKFWDECDKISVDYLASVMTDDDRHAWGVETGAGLSDELKDKISANYKARLMTKRMPQIFRELALQNQWELCEQYEAQIEELRKLWNQKVTLTIDTAEDLMVEDDEGKEKHSVYEGCTVRFKGLKDKVNNPKEWETVINKNGKGSISFTLLSHMIANAGTEIEIVQKEGNSERVLLTDSFIFQQTDWYSYPKLFAAYTIKDFPEAEEIGAFPKLSMNMKVLGCMDTKYYDPAQFSLSPDGKFSIALPANHLTNEPGYDGDVMRVTVNSLDCEPYTFIGDMSNELQVTSTGDSITLYSRDITLENGFTSTGQYFEIDHPNSDHPFEDTKDETHIFRRMLPNMVEDWDNEINFSSIKLVITPNSGGNGGKLRIVLNTIVEYHVDSYSYHWDKTDSDDYQDRFPAGFEAELTDTQIDAFKECFPVE